MKTKIKRHSRSVVSVVLAVCMLLSCVAVGIIATNAAYIGGNPKTAENMKANTADVANSADKTENEAVGAKAPEAVGANADSEKVGTTGWYVKDKNGSVLGDNIHDKDFTFSVTSTMLTGNDVYIKITDENGKKYGNNNSVGYGKTITAQESDNHCVKLTNAKNYSSITLHIKYNGSTGNNTCSVYWKSGVSTSYTISYNNPANGSFTTKPTSANSGDTVTFVTKPDTGYETDTVTVKNGSTAVSTTKTGNTYKFTMPSANVNVTASFKKAKYDITANATECTVAGFTSQAEYGSTVNFTVTPHANYALKTLTVKQGTTTISVTDNGGSYSFTMPAGAVTITATCATTSGAVDVYFKSATAWVYHPFITVNDGAEKEMTFDSLLQNGPKASVVKPKSDTGSLRYAWYKVSLTGVDTSKPVTIKIRGKDTYMEAEGTFNIGAGSQVYLACDNLMEGSTLVDLSSQTLAVKDFYDTPLHMVATAAEIAKING